jgi:RNA polymerase primary sigma factor
VTPLLAVLDKRELKIIEARFGLDGQKPRTLEEVGQEFNVTRERIRQLQNIALKKLRRALQKKDKPTPHIKNGTIKTKKKVVKEVTLLFPMPANQIISFMMRIKSDV